MKQDIDISHRLPSANTKKPIIIKFARMTIRNNVLNFKSKLKSDIGPKLSITETLTKRRLRLLENARQIFGYKNVWSSKGEIYCFFNNKKQHIINFDGIDRIRFNVE